MKSLFSLLFAVSLLAGSAVLAVAQRRTPAQTNAAEQQDPPFAPRDYSALVQEVFAPITDQLSLTKEQQFQIVAIITGTEVSAEPMVQKIEELDQQLAAASLIDSPDEAEIERLSAQEADLLTQMIAMKALAKASIYQLLTVRQKTLVSHRFRGKSQIDGSLGAISVY